METTVINATEYRELSLSQLNESKPNPRRVFDAASLNEFAAVIHSQGVSSPLLVRPLTGNDFEIVAGARRYRAAQTGRTRNRACAHHELTDAASHRNAVRREPDSRRMCIRWKRRTASRDFWRWTSQNTLLNKSRPARANNRVYLRSRIRLTDLCPRLSKPFTETRSASAMRCCWRNCQPTSRNRLFRLASRRYTTIAQNQARILLPVRHLQFWIE